jgi:nucleotide-binding universal stress UspA family protein
MYQHILAPIDFSPHSAAACAFATELAAKFGAELHVVHVYRPPVEFLSPYDLSVPTSLDGDSRELARKSLDEEQRKVQAAGVKCEARLLDGIADQAIVKAAVELGADLIVMGSRGHTGIVHAVLGSVAERVIRQSPVAVITVKDG